MLSDDDDGMGWRHIFLTKEIPLKKSFNSLLTSHENNKNVELYNAVLIFKKRPYMVVLCSLDKDLTCILFKHEGALL